MALIARPNVTSVVSAVRIDEYMPRRFAAVVVGSVPTTELSSLIASPPPSIRRPANRGPYGAPPTLGARPRAISRRTASLPLGRTPVLATIDQVGGQYASSARRTICRAPQPKSGAVPAGEATPSVTVGAVRERDPERVVS